MLSRRASNNTAYLLELSCTRKGMITFFCVMAFIKGLFLFLQCQSISSLELVEDLKLLRVGQIPGNRRTRHIPPPPPTPPPDPPINGVNVREQVNVFNAVAHRK